MDHIGFEQRVEQERWLLSLTCYDRQPALYDEEREVLARYLREREVGKQQVRLIGLPAALGRLYAPIEAALVVTRASEETHRKVLYLLLRQIHDCQCLYWGWSSEQWQHFFNANPRLTSPAVERHCGQHLLGVAYLLTGFSEFQSIACYASPAVLAARIFGRVTLDDAARQLYEELVRRGYRSPAHLQMLKRPIGEVMLRLGSSRLEEITLDVLRAVHDEYQSKADRKAVARLAYALYSLGIVEGTLFMGNGRRRPEPREGKLLESVPPVWASWCQRWLDTATQRRRARIYRVLLQAGRWLARTYPDITSPAEWTREIAIAYVAAVDRQQVGEWRVQTPSANAGKPLRARTKANTIAALRTFFLDCQAWGWIPARFDPRRCLVVPRAVKALLVPQPRPIADEVWAKLLWAGLNLTEADLVGSEPSPFAVPPYPFAMVRAVALTWLLAGLRSDELRRLRLGCIRQQPGPVSPETAEAQSHSAVCWLEVPPNKSGPAFTKPVEALLGEAVAAWEQARPPSPAALDPKTGDLVHYLFCYRGIQLGVRYLNETLIPLLCRKAGIPCEDQHGTITSHRARATMASHLANASQPMSLLALQQWLGHQSPEATLQYVKDNPVTLAQAYTDAGYFGRNVRLVEVLIDREAIQNGATAQGAPWKFYDLGHGYCTYDFFDQCPHRMVCARCAFYRPKAATHEQWLEARDNLQRMLHGIPLTDDEQRAVQEEVDAIEQLCLRLADQPTPAGLTSRQMAAHDQHAPMMIPVASIPVV
ncbi:MAG TPA: transposase [Chloroflexi bacterium]|nr:transposase [Chloroflexota bacterium]